MPTPIIEINRLSKRYQLGQFGMTSFREEAEKWLGRRRRPSAATAKHQREFWALRDVSFSVSPGEVVGIIGRNGAGKSTLLKILSRITEPTAGEVVLRGRVASLLEVGTGFHPELSGRDNIFLNGAILGMKRAEIAAKFDEIVAFAEVERFIDTPVKRYSSGMYVRLAFAVAAHLEPEILIVDEVLAVGDARFQRKCITKMANVAEQSGRTVLFVSHSMDAVARLCPRALLLQNGTIAFAGATAGAVDLYQRLAQTESHVPIDEWIDLAPYRKDRERIEFVRFALRNLTRPKATSIFPDERVRIDLEISAKDGITVNNLAVMLSTTDGVRLINLDTGKLGQSLAFVAGTQIVSLQINSLPLAPGDFILNFYLANTRGHQIFHHIVGRHTLHVTQPAHADIVDIPELDGVLHTPFSVSMAPTQIHA